MPTTGLLMGKVVCRIPYKDFTPGFIEELDKEGRYISIVLDSQNQELLVVRGD